jgi:GntR family transcriptional repressor for pyruvate dehydrogenase complex
VGPVRKSRLSEGVVDAIRRMIADEGFAPGDKFYSENELTAQLQVSRSSLREAIRILEVTGLLSVRHGKGIFVQAPSIRPHEGFVDWLKHNDQSLQEHFEVRLIIEPQTARLAALAATPNEIEELADIHARFARNSRLGLTAETIDCDREFHKVLAKATHNKMLHALIRSLATSLFDDWISSFHTPGRMDKTVIEHGQVLEAIRNRDAAAASDHMAAHLRNAIREISQTSSP